MNDLLTVVTDRVFAYALNTVKRIPRTGSPRPPTADRLKLYGLYKQSMEGDVEGVMRRPPDDAPDTEETRVERNKWYRKVFPCSLPLTGVFWWRLGIK